MTKNRLEAFSDGVIAIIITIMILEIKVPNTDDWKSLFDLAPRFLSYALSFIYVGIYWNNHHHMIQAVKKGINGRIMWANLHLLFWLSLIPFSTGWMGEHNFSQRPSIIYGIILFLSAIAYNILARQIIKNEGNDSAIAKAVGKDVKGNISLFLYVSGIATSFITPWISLVMYFIVAIMWLIPDKRIERILESDNTQEE